MSRAVYAKLWMATSQFQARRQYAYYRVWSRVCLWGVPLAMWGAWLVFPALEPSYKKMVTLGIWKPPKVGYLKDQTPPFE